MDDAKLSILIVEDNPMFHTIMTQMINQHDVYIASNSKEALKQFEDVRPNIVFLDIALPDGSGHEVLQKIKSVDENAYVVMMTASRLREDVLKSMEAGAEGYIMKPFSEDMINEAIKEYRDSR